MLADSKKVQTFINVAAAEIATLKASARRLKALRSTFNALGIWVAGTPLDGKLSALSNWIDAVDATADAAVPNGLSGSAAGSHRSTALGDF